MGIMTPAMDDQVVAVGFASRWTPERQTYAGHTAAPFVETSKKQFFEAVGSLDIVTSVKGDRDSGYSAFESRQGSEVGRIYSDGRGITPSRYVLRTEFAARRREILARP